MIRRTLTARVIAVLAITAIVPAVIIGLLAATRARRSVKTEVIRGHLALVRAVGATLDARLQGTRKTLELAAAAWADQRDALAPFTENDHRVAERLLRRLRRELSMVSRIAIVDPDGDHLAGDLMTVVGVGAHTFGGYIGDAVIEDGHVVARAVIQARSRTGELCGAFIAELDLGFIADTLAMMRLGRGARLYVVDGRGVPIAATGDLPLGRQSLRGIKPAVDRALATATEGSLESGGVVAVYRNLSSFQSLYGVRWALILEQPQSDAYALASHAARDTLLVGSISLAVALLLGAFLAARLTRPLRDLATRADAIASGDAEARGAPPSPTSAPGEIGALARQIDDMAARIGEREKLQAALAHGDRLATVGAMAARVAHEINNPLTTVLGYAKLLAEDKPDDNPDRPGLDLIADEAERMKAIVGGLLGYARGESASASAGPTDANAVTKAAVSLVAPTLREKRISLNVSLAEDLSAARCSEDALKQVLVNLIKNAAEATPPGGTIELSTRAGDACVEITVTDSGSGIPEGDRERVFEPFFTTKPEGAGTGLGLAVCRHLASGFGGSIVCEAADHGDGAQFRVVIPMKR